MEKNYQSYGGFVVPRKNKIVDHRSLDIFWETIEDEVDGLSTANGCYVFAMKSGPGIRPWYIGKANGKKGFRQEVFGDHKLKLYNTHLSEKRGTPLIFLIAAKNPKKGFRSLRNPETLWVENFLISLAIEANEKLLNRKNTKLLQECSIPGLLNSRKDSSKKMSSTMKKLFNIKN